jgi:protoporphyrinogen oxidase
LSQDSHSDDSVVVRKPTRKPVGYLEQGIRELELEKSGWRESSNDTIKQKPFKPAYIRNASSEQTSILADQAYPKRVPSTRNQVHSLPPNKLEDQARRQTRLRNEEQTDELLARTRKTKSIPLLQGNYSAVPVNDLPLPSPPMPLYANQKVQSSVALPLPSPTKASTTHSTVKVLILGAGPTGLGAAHQLQSQGCQDWVMIDSRNRPGGNAVTEVDQHGFRWDLGGHVIHSHYKSFDKAAALHNDWVHPNRGGWVRVDDQWCPTPIQQSLGNLKQGKKITKELRGKGRGAAKPDAKSSNLAEYYRNKFGDTLNETFFAPFNRKQWAWNLEELDHTWTSLRSGSGAANVPPPNAALTHLDKPIDTSAFPYPRLGTGSLWKSIANALPAEKQRYQATIKSLDLYEKKAHLSTGETISFSRCISTIPLNAMLGLVGHHRPDLAKMSSSFRHSSTTVIGLGFQGELPEVLKNKTWIFSADPEVDFHRATVVTNFSKSLSDGGDKRRGPRWSIMFETASSPLRNINVEPGHLVANHLKELQKWGAIQEGHAPLSVWHKHLDMGYPLPFLGRDDLLSSSQNKVFFLEVDSVDGDTSHLIKIVHTNKVSKLSILS